MEKALLENIKISQEQNDKANKKKKYFNLNPAQLFRPANSLNSSLPDISNSFCSGDQCLIGGNPSITTPPTTQHIINMQKLSGSNTLQSQIILEAPSGEQDTALNTLFPKELYDALIQAAKRGFLYSFLSTLSEDYITDYLKQHECPPSQIYLVHQAIRALGLLVLGATLGKTLTAPIVSYLLSSYLGMNENAANYLTTATLITADVINNSMALPQTLFTLGVSVGANIIGSKVAQACYENGSTFIRNSLFKLVSNNENPRDIEEMNSRNEKSPSIKH